MPLAYQAALADKQPVSPRLGLYAALLDKNADPASSQPAEVLQSPVRRQTVVTRPILEIHAFELLFLLQLGITTLAVRKVLTGEENMKVLLKAMEAVAAQSAHGLPVVPYRVLVQHLKPEVG